MREMMEEGWRSEGGGRGVGEMREAGRRGVEEMREEGRRRGVGEVREE